MATHKSAEKRARQSIRKNTRNSQTLSTVRTIEKKLRAAIAGGNASDAQALLSGYMSKISKAASKGVVHANTASRKIGRLSERVFKLAK